GEMDLVREWRRRSKETPLQPPRVVDSGPVMENADVGEEVDVLKFPVPKWHELDGGRFIGTGDVVVTRGPDGGWVNLGTYRVMVHDRNHVGLLVAPFHHGYGHMQEWHARGQAMPVAIVAGMDPLLFLVASNELPPGVNEYDYAGAIQGEPVEVVRGPVTGLPIPAGAEIVLEGFVEPGDVKLEGPFGEFTGYYASGAQDLPVVRVEAVYYRNNPIILGSPPLKPPIVEYCYLGVAWNALLWDVLEAAGVPDVTGVCIHMTRNMLVAVSVKQRYPGHSKQAGRIAAQSSLRGGIGHITIVVDDDIDVGDMDEVLWAMCTRVDPERDIEVLRECTSSFMDPMALPEKRGGPLVHSRLVIDATRPYEWRDRFPEVVASSPELRQQVLARWGEALKGIV
ncbi:MAG TPA: UbiD family decarboxylase, partial [Dehalococcoidia bacterium]|nr:UbiD family decarboxylase [Dehalococcoidia bacterium]